MNGREVVTRFPPRRENILLMFHALQDEHQDRSYIPLEDRAAVAEYLDMSVAEVDGVLSFYQAFAREPRGTHVLRICDSLSCRICGSLDLYQHVRRLLNVSHGESTADGRFSVEFVNCLGCCDSAPNLMIDDMLVRGVDADGLAEILDDVAAADRKGAATEGGHGEN
jgi:NADH:ubiquinone oxidoreductase subunit E